jgi:hypothetical protein
MGHSARLLLIGKTTYYVGWVALLCGALGQLNLAKSLFMPINLTKRNLLEVGVVCFIICMASEVRAMVSTEKELPAP